MPETRKKYDREFRECSRRPPSTGSMTMRSSFGRWRRCEPGGRLIAQWGGLGSIDSVLRVMAALGLPTDRWNFASEAETEAHRRAAGFSGVTVWSHPDPASFSSREELETSLDSVVLFEVVGGLPAERRRVMVSAVADRLGVLSLDYFRLNVLAKYR